jgi:hypothetical protein
MGKRKGGVMGLSAAQGSRLAYEHGLQTQLIYNNFAINSFLYLPGYTTGSTAPSAFLFGSRKL